MSAYSKAIAALIGGLFMIANDMLNLGLSEEQYTEQVNNIVSIIAFVAMVFGVYQVRNTPS